MAQQNDDGQEKTLDPTQQRLDQAREKGDVPRSPDANQAAAYIAFLVVLFVAAESVGVGLSAPLTSFIANPHLMADGMFGPSGSTFASEIINEAAIGAAPLLLLPFAAVLISLIAQRAIAFSPEKLLPKLERINPIANAAQKFGPSGLVEFVKNLAKMLAVAIALVVLLITQHDGVAHYVALDAKSLPSLMLREAILVVGAATAIAILIAAIDLPWQQYDHARKLKMSYQDMKDEAKRTEGDPMMKQTRQRRAREIANNQMLKEVPNADVVVVNPTHYAVALKWARTPGSAPICVAKGVDEIAKKIREIAVENEVPIHSDPPTARALYATVDLDQEIDQDHYQAVAAAIRFADGLRAQMRAANQASSNQASGDNAAPSS